MKIKLLSVILAAIMIFSIGLSLFTASGFKKRTDVFLQDYSVSGDGSAITVKTALSGSMGYIRDMKAEQNGDAVYCSFYRTFGGLNSSIGSKNRFTIKLDSASAKIYFDRGEAGNVLVLQKDETTNTWMRI